MSKNQNSTLAEKWASIEETTNKLSLELANKLELSRTVAEQLVSLNKELKKMQSQIDKLSSFAQKEVLRAESNTLNDDYDVPVETIAQPEIIETVAESDGSISDSEDNKDGQVPIQSTLLDGIAPLSAES